MGIFNNRFTARLLGLAIVGVALIVAGLSSLISAVSYKSDIRKNLERGENIIDFMYPTDYKLNENVCGYINYLYECFCEETTTNTVNGVKTWSRVSGSYYLMPIINSNDNELYYITVLVKDKDAAATCEQLVDDTYAYLLGDDVEFTDLFFTGKIKPLESDVKNYLVEWVKDVELFDDNSATTIDKYVLPYQIEEYNIENHYNSAKMFLPVGVLVVAVCALIIILSVKKNKKQDEEQTFGDAAPYGSNVSFKPQENTSASQHTQAENIAEVPDKQPESKADDTVYSAVAVEEAADTSDEAKSDEDPKVEVNANEAYNDEGMLSATVSAEDVDNLPDDSSAKPPFNYDDDGMGGIDVSALDLSSLDDYKDEDTSDDAADNNIYSSDDEEYTFDADPSSIRLSDMDK